MAKTINISELDDQNMIVVHKVTENEDGTASVQLDLGANAVQLLIELGFRALVKEAIKTSEEKK